MFDEFTVKSFACKDHDISKMRLERKPKCELWVKGSSLLIKGGQK